MTDALRRYTASVPYDALPYVCLEISHPDWSAAVRRVMQPDAVTVAVEGVLTMFSGWNTAGAWASRYPATDDTGRAIRNVDVDDVDNALLRQIEAVAESDAPVTVRVWKYISTDTGTPLLSERYQLQQWEPGDDGVLSLRCVSRDLSVLADPFIRHTRGNTPGLRGR
ncbi:MAG: hypothetical protein NTZ11_18465 [Gammaproteobacteria bacterium]|nr:hypothetical protein [Gammaproteobacteria bacterium]